MKWLLGLLVTIVYYVRGDVCVHPELGMESGGIMETTAEGRHWRLTVACTTCGERWTMKAQTRHRF